LSNKHSRPLGFPSISWRHAIVHEVNVCTADIFFLFIIENMLIKIVLQMLISIVDIKLFKAKKNTE
jgi:hypothetical protein